MANEDAYHKVFIATARTPEEFKQAFGDLAKGFKPVYSEEEKSQAYFWVLDLGKLPRNAQKFIRERKPPELPPLNLPLHSPVPCLFVMLEGELGEEAKKLMEYAADILKLEPVVAEGLKQLGHHLQWLYCMLPFKRMPEAKDLPEILQVAVQLQRTGIGGRRQ